MRKGYDGAATPHDLLTDEVDNTPTRQSWRHRVAQVSIHWRCTSTTCSPHEARRRHWLFHLQPGDTTKALVRAKATGAACGWCGGSWLGACPHCLQGASQLAAIWTCVAPTGGDDCHSEGPCFFSGLIEWRSSQQLASRAGATMTTHAQCARARKTVYPKRRASRWPARSGRATSASKSPTPNTIGFFGCCSSTTEAKVASWAASCPKTTRRWASLRTTGLSRAHRCGHN